MAFLHSFNNISICAWESAKYFLLNMSRSIASASFLFNFAGMDDAGARKIIEFIELYRILGIKHAVLYDAENSTSEVMQAIKYYRNIDFLSKFNKSNCFFYKKEVRVWSIKYQLSPKSNVPTENKY